jgi:hypothetical protein
LSAAPAQARGLQPERSASEIESCWSHTLQTFSVHEDDNVAHGADDFLGSVQTEWNDLDTSSYTTFIVDDAQLKIARD